MNSLRVASHQGFKDMPVSQVTSVKFTPIGNSPAAKAVHAEKSDAAEMLALIDFEKPFVTDAVPGSIIIGTITITSETADKELQVRSFSVLGASLLQDTAFPNTYYYTSPELYKRLTR